MVEVQVSGQFKAVENKVFTLKQYTETFVLEDRHLALNVIQNKLIIPRLREKYPLFNNLRTCQIDSIKDLQAKDKAVKKVDCKSIRDYKKITDIAELKEFCLYNGYAVNLTKAKDLKQAYAMIAVAIKEKEKKSRLIAQNVDDEAIDESNGDGDPLTSL